MLISDLTVWREKKTKQIDTSQWQKTGTFRHKKKKIDSRTVQLLWVKTELRHPSSVPSPPPPPCCFPSPPVSEVCWFVGFGLERLKARTGLTQPQEDWITPSIGVSCQMVSCTCCLKQGGPAAATARPTLEHIITASKMITLFTHAHTHNRWLFHTHSSLSPSSSLWRRFT